MPSDASGRNKDIIPLSKLDGAHPGTLGMSMLGFGMTVLQRCPPDKRAEVQQILERFEHQQITDMETLALLRDLLGEAFIRDNWQRVNSLFEHGMRLRKDKIVDRASKVDMNQRMESAVQTIVKKSKQAQQ